MVEEHDVGRDEVVVEGRGQLYPRQKIHGPALRHQMWSPVARVLPRELLGIHQAHPGAEGIDADALPGQVEEREAGHHGQFHPAIAAEQLDGSLGHQR